MTNNNGWTGKPGVPLNPEKSRYHWLVFPKTKHWPQGKIQIGEWCGEEKVWYGISDCSLSPADIADWRYLGPCLTPAEVEARVKEARRDAREEAARRLEELHRQHKYNPKTGDGSEHDTGYYRALVEGAGWIRALNGEGDD